jgi:pSer/pThr/pTyr-binding forkhead associated (FHA) protein
VNLELGVVCGSCDAYSPMGTTHCATCNHDLALYREKTSIAPPPIALVEKKKSSPAIPATKNPTLSPGQRTSSAPRAQVQSRPMPPVAPSASMRRQSSTGLEQNGPVSARSRPQAPEVLPRGSSSIVPKVEVVGASPESWGHDTTGKIPLRQVAAGMAKGKSKEELMEQAKNYVCRSCQTPIPSGHKFCGRCGAAVPPDVLSLREEFYGTLQVPGRAKLILIRAEGDAAMEGLSFALNAQEHVVGRQGHLTFPEDRFVSPRHANLFYRDGKLVVRDEGSVNGVYVRLRGTIDIQGGDMFLAGEELFRVDATPKATDHPDPDGTYFWSSPKRPSPFRIAQILQGGAVGNVVCSRETGITIGREGGEMNYPTDVYMSATHCRVEAEASGGKLTLTDLNSRNGTYIRMRGERELAHGDYIFIGKKILRVEVTS